MGMFLFLCLLFSSSMGEAGPFLTNLRDDQRVPEKCQEARMDFFNAPIETFFVGRSGGRRYGFTFEYPILRNDARKLWMYFKDAAYGDASPALLEQILETPRLKVDFDIINREFKERDFDFASQGEILEFLAIHHLHQEFPENLYFITGGVTYHEEYSPMVIGELDIYVGRKDTCEMVAIGEAKLGGKKTLAKARTQLGRFQDFVRSHSFVSFIGEYTPVNGDLLKRQRSRN